MSHTQDPWGIAFLALIFGIFFGLFIGRYNVTQYLTGYAGDGKEYVCEHSPKQKELDAIKVKYETGIIQ